MKKYWLVIAVCLLFVHTRAQFALIPDTAFATWLQNNGFGQCMVGNQLDTNCTLVLNAHKLSCFAQPVHDLTGIRYFKNLDSLDCSNDSLTSLPALPVGLKFLNCNYNNITSITSLPASATYVSCSYNKLTSLPALPALTTLVCVRNRLTGLPALPVSLSKLNCTGNRLDTLPELPASLRVLQCDSNPLSVLPVLPAGLQTLHCSAASIATLPVLPASLTNLDCRSNRLTELPQLPDGLKFLFCGENQLDELPILPAYLQQLDCTQGSLLKLPLLPASLTSLYCGRNSIDTLPHLPAALQRLYCDHNNIRYIPNLPAALNMVYCSNNNLTQLPAIPASVYNLLCDHNNLTELPELPDSLYTLQCNHNNNLYCLPQLKKIKQLYFDHTQVTCLPNYGSVAYSYPPLNTVPLCANGNPNACNTFWNVSGKVYFDANDDCTMGAGDSAVARAKVVLYDNNNVVSWCYTGSSGYYSFNVDSFGTYYVVVDTLLLPYRVSCPGTTYRTVTISAADSMAYAQDFALTCRNTGFDLGVSDIINGHNTARPGAVVPVYSVAGDIAHGMNTHCSHHLSGKVKLVISGPAYYSSSLPYAEPPASIVHDTITWHVSDFSQINNATAFGINLLIDTLAQAGQHICIDEWVIADSAGDYNHTNNNMQFCFDVVSSLDPNILQVSPEGDNITTADWLTYTVRFQNTGNAIAQRITVIDTLDAALDPATFAVLNSSHNYAVSQLSDHILQFVFQAINLPDSNIDENGSHGYLQFKILPKQNAQPGAAINNTAYIYFDYNAPVATNSTLNHLALQVPTSVAVNKQAFEFELFPNPASTRINVIVDNSSVGGMLYVYNAAGQLVHSMQLTTRQSAIQVSGFPAGLYLVKYNGTNGFTETRRVIVHR